MTTINRQFAAAVPQSKHVVAFDASTGYDRKLTPAQVQASGDAVLKTAVANASVVMNFLRDRFGRNGLDGRGQQLEVVVHAEDPEFGGPMTNAYWDTMVGRMYLGDGDGRVFAPFGNSLDLIAHEAGHAILESEVRMDLEGEGGALHESFGDVLGALVDPQDWQIGEELVLDKSKLQSFRDMQRPAVFTHMDQARFSDGEPHDLADIPNLVAYRVADKIGREAMGHVWYQGFTEHLRDHAKFADAAVATVTAAQRLFGADSHQASAVSDAWASVGVLDTPRATSTELGLAA